MVLVRVDLGRILLSESRFGTGLARILGHQLRGLGARGQVTVRLLVGFQVGAGLVALLRLLHDVGRRRRGRGKLVGQFVRGASEEKIGLLNHSRDDRLLLRVGRGARRGLH